MTQRFVSLQLPVLPAATRTEMMEVFSPTWLWAEVAWLNQKVRALLHLYSLVFLFHCYRQKGKRRDLKNLQGKNLKEQEEIGCIRICEQG